METEENTENVKALLFMRHSSSLVKMSWDRSSGLVSILPSPPYLFNPLKNKTWREAVTNECYQCIEMAHVTNVASVTNKLDQTGQDGQVGPL